MTVFNCSLLIIVSNNRKRWFVYKSDSGPGSFLSKLWATVLLTAEQQVPWFFRLVEEKRKQQLICSLLPSCVPLWYCTFYFLFIFRPRPCCPRCSMGLLPINKDSEAGIFRGFFYYYNIYPQSNYRTNNPCVSDKKGIPPEKQIRAGKWCYMRTQTVYSCTVVEPEILSMAAEKYLTLWYMKSRSVKY